MKITKSTAVLCTTSITGVAIMALVSFFLIKGNTNQTVIFSMGIVFVFLINLRIYAYYMKNKSLSDPVEEYEKLQSYIKSIHSQA